MDVQNPLPIYHSFICGFNHICHRTYVCAYMIHREASRLGQAISPSPSCLLILFKDRDNLIILIGAQMLLDDCIHL